MLESVYVVCHRNDSVLLNFLVFGSYPFEKSLRCRRIQVFDFTSKLVALSVLVAHCVILLNHSDVLTVVSDQQAVYLAGDSVEYGCPKGYQLSGSAVRFCQSDFTWTGRPANCHKGTPEYVDVILIYCQP